MSESMTEEAKMKELKAYLKCWSAIRPDFRAALNEMERWEQGEISKQDMILFAKFFLLPDSQILLA